MPTPKERVLAALNREESDIVPCQVVIEADLEDRLNKHYGGTEWEKTVRNHLGFAAYPYWAKTDMTDDGLMKDEYGSLWDFSKLPFHLTDFPLKEPSVAGYDFEAVAQVVVDSLDVAAAEETIREKSDRFVFGMFYFGLFERSWMLRGFENVLVDSILNTSFYEELLDNILEIQLQQLDRILELPIDAVHVGDDWGDQRGVILGPDRWRRFIKPRAAKLYERAHAADKIVFSHCCGNVFDIIPDMIEIGLDGLESLQPEAMDVYEIKRAYGKDLLLWGGLGTQHMLPFGSPKEVRDETRRLIEELGAGGGYILAPAKPLMEDIPTANAVALIEEFAQGM